MLIVKGDLSKLVRAKWVRPAEQLRFCYFGPSGVCALPLAAGTNEGVHYFHYIFDGI